VESSGNFFGKAASSVFSRSTSEGGSALFIIDIAEIVLRLNAAMIFGFRKSLLTVAE
jgi:hypothetical protein